MIRDAKETTVVVNVGENSRPSAADEILKLSELVDKGLLTPEGFQAAKQRLLA